MFQGGPVVLVEVGAASTRTLVDGSAVLRDKKKPPLELSPEECLETGGSAIQETARILGALGVVACWRLAEDVAVSNIIEVLAGGLRGAKVPELVSEMDSLANTTEQRLNAQGLLPESAPETPERSSN